MVSEPATSREPTASSEPPPTPPSSPLPQPPHVRPAAWLQDGTFLGLLLILAVLPFLLNVWWRLGNLEFPLDDAYIYLHYARSLAEGRFYEYNPGEGYSGGCTGLLYPWLLVPGFLLGLEDAELIPYVYGLSTLLIGTCLALGMRLGQLWAGSSGRYLVPLLMACHGAWLWSALSGLEGALFTTAVLSLGLLLELSAQQRRLRAARIALVLAVLPLIRPEGGTVAMLGILCAFWLQLRQSAAGPAGTSLRTPSIVRLAPREWILRAVAWLLCLGPAVGVGLWHQEVLGHWTPNTAVHKSALYYPRQSLEGLLHQVFKHLERLGWDIFQSPRPFMPLWGATLLLGLGWGLWRGWRLRSSSQGMVALFWVLASLGLHASALVAKGPGTHARYHAVPLLLLTVLCAGFLAEQLSSVRQSPAQHRWKLGGLLVAGGVLLVAASREPEWIDRFATAAVEIRSQHRVMASEVSRLLPADAILAANDVGALAYYSRRALFDVTGLTTNRVAEVSLEGGPALLELLEGWPEARRPTHFVIYPHWLNFEAMLGRKLRRTWAPEQRVVAGGNPLLLAEVDWRGASSGHRLWSAPEARIQDRLDIADLEAEAAHGHHLEEMPERRGQPHTTVALSVATQTGVRFDGGRPVLGLERFRLNQSTAGKGVLLARVMCTRAPGARVQVWVDGRSVGAFEGAVGRDCAWKELRLPLGELAVGEHAFELSVQDHTPWKVLHYFLLLDADLPPLSPSSPGVFQTR